MDKVRLAPIFRPEARRPAPKPAQVDLRTVFAFCTLYWLMPLLAFVVIQLAHHDMLRPIIVCASGVAIGVLLLIWERINRKRYRKLAE